MSSVGVCFIGLRLSGHNATSPVLNDVHCTFICDVCSTEYKRVYWTKERHGSHMKKGKFYNELWDIWRFISHVSFRAFSSFKNMPADVNGGQWQTEMSFRFSDGTLPRYPLTLALPRLFITKAIVFSAIIQCIQDFSVCLFLHRNISYICQVQTSHPPRPL